MAWLGRVLRLMVVFLLVFDQLSAPLHKHHHDAGPDGVMQQFFLSGGHASDPHMEQAEDPAVIHAVTGIKREARHSPVFQTADELPPVIFATLFAVLRDMKDALPRSWPFETRLSIAAYRSLPPGGRAPPLHT